MNIIVLVIDTLRYDYIGAHGNAWMRTPNMDRLAAESWIFRHSYTGSYPTIPHRTDALTGRYGGPFHVWKPLAFDAVTIPRALAAEGYLTQLIHDTPHLVNGGHAFDYPFQYWTQVRGAEVDRPWADCLPVPGEGWCRDPLFDHVDPAAVAGHPSTVTYLWANRKRKRPEDWSCARLWRTAAEWLSDNARREKFFLWVDCFDPHEPWDAPPEMVRLYDQTPGYDGRIDPRAWIGGGRGKASEAARKRLAAFYAAKVSWVDRWLGEFLDALDRTGLSKNTALIFTADHGTNVGEDGRFGKRMDCPGFNEAHTPFWVRPPGGEGGNSDVLVQPQDLFATVLALAGAAPPKGIESFDVLSAARRGHPGQRRLALSGTATNHWAGRAGAPLFSAFDGTWWLQFAARPEDSVLTPIANGVGAPKGDTGAAQRKPGAAEGNAGALERLHAAALEEMARRGTDPGILAWLRGRGRGEFPKQARFYDGWPAPAGYQPYWQRLYGCP